MRVTKLILCFAAFTIIASGPGWAQGTVVDRCEEFCFDGLEAALHRCEALPAGDQRACIDRALNPFGACMLPCAKGGTMSVFRLPDGRAQLVVRPAGTSGTVRHRAFERRRTHLLTVPILRGVNLSNGVFPDLAALSRYVMRTYGAASDADNSGGGCTRPDGCAFSGPPRIFLLMPSSGPAFMPVGIAGANFDRGTIPYINSVPSVSLFNFSARNLPLLGSVSVGFTIVPPAAPSGPGAVTVEYNGQQSNRFPFTKN